MNIIEEAKKFALSGKVLSREMIIDLLNIPLLSDEDKLKTVIFVGEKLDVKDDSIKDIQTVELEKDDEIEAFDEILEHIKMLDELLKNEYLEIEDYCKIKKNIINRISAVADYYN